MSPLPLASWWRRRTRLGRIVIVLAVILLFQIALALSTEYTILPAVQAITHNDNWGGELATFLLLFVQLLLCIPTVAGMVILASVIIIRARRNR